MGPQEVGGPDDVKKAIVDFIDGARKKLFIAEAIVRPRRSAGLVCVVAASLMAACQDQAPIAPAQEPQL